MTIYLLRRLSHSAILLVGLTLFLFGLVHLAPSSPAHVIAGLRIGDIPSAEQVAQVRAAYGFDLPLPVQYGNWLLRTIQGDLGDSIRTGKPVAQELWARLGFSIRLGTAAMAAVVVLGLGTGLLSALARGSRSNRVDQVVRTLSLALVSVPDFWLAFLFIMIFSVQLGWLPSFGARSGLHFVLPVATLALGQAARLSRLTRSIVLDQLHRDYLRTAKAKGLPQTTQLLAHVLPNAAVPLVTVLAFQFAGLLSGTIIVETVFSLPGLGSAYVEAVTYRDLPMIQAIVLTFALIVLITNLLADLSYGLFDPRIRLGHRPETAQ